ncbi:MAG: heavy metal-responsive transcriptional regulator [Acidobacteriota bacterium]
MKAYLRSGEMARLAGVSADTLRHYERKGLLPAPRRSQNGYREYHHSLLDRVRMIRRALAVGFTIDELADIFRQRATGGVPCRRVRALAEEKLAEVEARLAEIKTLRDELREMIRDWDYRLLRSGPDERAGLLESLASHGEEKLSPLAPSAIRRKRDRGR